MLVYNEKLHYSKVGDEELSLLLIVVATGIPGFLSYAYLSQLGIILFSKNEKDDKVIVLSIFSFLNIGLSFCLFYWITGIEPSKSMVLSSVLKLFIITLIVSAVLTLTIYPYLLKKMKKTIEIYQEKNNIDVASNQTVIDKIINNSEYKFKAVYIFDFENNFIESGYLKRYSGEETAGFQISLVTDTFYNDENPTFNEVLKEFNSSQTPEANELFLDLDKKIKIFIFKHN